MHEWACCHDKAANHQLPIAAAFWIIWIVSMEECSSLKQIWCRFIPLLTQSFWMWWSHNIHAHSVVSTDPMTSTVKSSLFMRVHSSPLSLAARLYQCCANHSGYINNGWTFSRQTWYYCNLLKPVKSFWRFKVFSSLFKGVLVLKLISFKNIVTFWKLSFSILKKILFSNQ